MSINIYIYYMVATGVNTFNLESDGVQLQFHFIIKILLCAYLVNLALGKKNIVSCKVENQEKDCWGPEGHKGCCWIDIYI